LPSETAPIRRLVDRDGQPRPFSQLVQFFPPTPNNSPIFDWVSFSRRRSSANLQGKIIPTSFALVFSTRRRASGVIVHSLIASSHSTGTPILTLRIIFPEASGTLITNLAVLIFVSAGHFLLAVGRVCLSFFFKQWHNVSFSPRTSKQVLPVDESRTGGTRWRKRSSLHVHACHRRRCASGILSPEQRFVGSPIFRFSRDHAGRGVECQTGGKAGRTDGCWAVLQRHRERGFCLGGDFAFIPSISSFYTVPN
jgi:hypothetical protein